MSKPIVGIDLGTTNSCMAFINKYGKPEIIPNAEGARLTPSIVYFDGKVPIVGTVAKAAATTDPLNTVMFVKRQMGNPVSVWQYRSESDEIYTAEEISAIILKRLVQDAQDFLGEEITEAVITVPAYFNDAQRKATKDAASIAGINASRIINEPTAAALAYGVDKSETDQLVLVYDLGGGTFDVTIMKISSNAAIKVLATNGDKNLGGYDFDNAIMKSLNEEFKRQGGCDLLDSPELEQDLREKAEAAKKALTQRQETKVFLHAGGKNIPITLTRIQFEEITQPLVKRTISIMDFALEDANLSWSQIDKVLLVGGSTRMPMISKTIENITGKKPSLGVHQDEAVAMGAAIQASLLQSGLGKCEIINAEFFPLVKVTDINPHSMGIVALDNNGQQHNAIVLKRGTNLPCEANDVFHTVVDGQTLLEINVTEGEDTDVNYVSVIAKAEIAIASYPKGAEVGVTFRYDHDAIVHVSVTDLTSGKFLGELEIKRFANMTKELIQEKKQKIAGLSVS